MVIGRIYRKYKYKQQSTSGSKIRLLWILSKEIVNQIKKQRLRQSRSRQYLTRTFSCSVLLQTQMKKKERKKSICQKLARKKVCRLTSFIMSAQLGSVLPAQAFRMFVSGKCSCLGHFLSQITLPVQLTFRKSLIVEKQAKKILFFDFF